MKFQTLGDPHLGRRFIHGVTLEKRGMREAMQWAQFEAHLMQPIAPYHINMGDLFDAALVPYNVLQRAAYIYTMAARKNNDVLYVVLRGNHDTRRDLTDISAFDLFADLVAYESNIIVVDEAPMQLNGMLFVPWSPIHSAAEMVNGFSGEISFGHWDIDSFGTDNPNLIPTKKLAEAGFDAVYTGHVHKPRTFTRDGINVHVVGSMQPFAHGEEVDESLYVTRSLPLDPDEDFSNRCLRLLLKKGETLEEMPDCLQLSTKRDGDDDDNGGLEPTTTLGDFNLASLFQQAFDETGVSEGVAKKVLREFERRRLING